MEAVCLSTFGTSAQLFKPLDASRSSVRRQVTPVTAGERETVSTRWSRQRESQKASVRGRLIVCGAEVPPRAVRNSAGEAREALDLHFGRRSFGAAAAAALVAAWDSSRIERYSAFALERPKVPVASEEGLPPVPEGFQRVFSDFNGYTFYVPNTWVAVRGQGADVFYRNPLNIDESLFVNVSSPSSSKFNNVEDLGTPEQAADKYMRQYLTEFMSTRIGVRRPAELIGATSLLADDNRMYYTCELNVKSYVNSNQLGITPEERIPYLEWDRRYLQIAGVANRRLYELRLQAPEKTFARDEGVLRDIVNSFRVLDLVAVEEPAA